MERNEELEKKIKELCKGELLPEHWKAQGREQFKAECVKALEELQSEGNIYYDDYGDWIRKKWAVNTIKELK